MNEAQLIDRVFRRITKGVPQNQAGLYRNAIKSVLPQAYIELGEKVAADSHRYTLLQAEFPLVLSPYIIGWSTDVQNATILIFKEEAQRNWLVTMPGQRFPLIRLPRLRDLYNPPPTPDYLFYTLHLGNIVVVDHLAQGPPDMNVTIYGNYIPTIANFGFDRELVAEIIQIVVNMISQIAFSTEPEEVQP